MLAISTAYVAIIPELQISTSGMAGFIPSTAVQRKVSLWKYMDLLLTLWLMVCKHSPDVGAEDPLLRALREACWGKAVGGYDRLLPMV